MTEHTAIRRRSRDGSDQRNRQIAAMLAEGRSKNEIAQDMGIAATSVYGRIARYGLNQVAKEIKESATVTEARLRADLSDDQAAWLDAQLQNITFADFVRAVIVDAFAEDAARPDFLGLTGGR